ncbi:ER membrane protein complex subunit 4-like [Oppia nitens]|uniref:ER membrane protein complex subunit 4-like n=1 Tax=Oppia nitens TaxID=1686743 RepID=UPI0023DCCBD3|nr:ER membrane protein complex subunit 4-like [Oppia nitens]
MSSNNQMNRNLVTKRHKWGLNFAQKLKTDRNQDLQSPPGYICPTTQIHSENNRENDHNLIVKKSWDIALAPMKQIPMNLFIMYMSGNSISIFPIMMVGMLFLRPIKALIQINTTFKMIEGHQAILQKLIYLIGNLLCVALALYKCQSMGLLPSHASDWLDFVDPPLRIEFSGGGIAL